MLVEDGHTISDGYRLRERLLTLLAASAALSTIFFWALNSYFKVDVPASLMFIGKDGWCKVPSQSIGVHCFGDFNERFMPNLSDPIFPPWHNNLELTPVGPFLTSFFNFLGKFVPQQSILIGLVLSSSALLVFPMWRATKKFSLDLRILWIFLGAVATYPFLATLDRLNYIVLTIPLLFIFGASYIQSDEYISPLRVDHLWRIIPILVIIKPQFILLSFAFIFLRDFKQAAKSIVVSTLSFCVFIVAAGKMDFHRLIEWVQVAVFYSRDFSDVQSAYHLNISMSRGLFIAVRSFQITASAFSVNFRTTSGTFNFVLNAFQIVVFLFVTVSLLLYGKRVRKFHLLSVALVLSSFLFGQYIAGYYDVVVLVVLALLVLDPSCALWGARSGSENDKESLTKARFTFTEIILILAITLSCTTVTIPMPVSGSFIFFWRNNVVVSPLLQQISSLFWLLYILAVSTKAFKAARKSKRQEAPESSKEVIDGNLQ